MTTGQLPVSASQIRYPFALPASRWKRTVKIAAGRVLLAVRRGYARKLLAEGDPMTFGLTDRLIMVGWAHRATPVDWPALSAMHQRFWAGQGGSMFSAAPEIADRFDDWFVSQHARPLDLLEGQHFPALCEIGCGNGLALDYASRRLPTLPRLIGIDINAEAIRRNADTWRDDPRLEFVNADAVDWIADNAGPGWAYFSNAGVLEYFPQDKVARLFLLTGERGGWWVITEPIYHGYDLDTETISRPHGTEFSFCHNHPHLLREAGWDVVDQYETEIGGTRFLTLTARHS